jgi:RNA polymerase sigma-70 factor (sigma-E family)
MRQFDGFAADTADMLLRTGYLMTGNAKDAEDLVQETYLKVVRRRHRVRSMDHPAAYARRILINQVLHDAGRRSRQNAELTTDVPVLDAADENAARALREVEDIAEFRWALAELPARQRTVLVLRYWAGLSVADVAEILGCSPATVTSTASRAAARLELPPENCEPTADRRNHRGCGGNLGSRRRPVRRPWLSASRGPSAAGPFHTRQ